MRKFIVTVDDKKYAVEVQEVNAGEELKATQPVATPKPAPETAPAPAPAPQTAAEGQTIVAPLAGVILSVRVNVGDQVEKGTILATLEALKLENEIVSPRAGKVTSVQVTQGQNVSAGDLMFVLE